MNPKETRQSAERVAQFLGTTLLSTAALSPSCRRVPLTVESVRGRIHLFSDTTQRTYTVYFSRRLKGHIVLVDQVQKFLSTPRSLFIYANFDLVTKFLRHFLEKRIYPVEDVSWREIIKFSWWQTGQGTLVSEGYTGQFNLRSFRGRFYAWLKDNDESKPYFCTLRRQYFFSFRKRLLIKSGKFKLESLLRTYTETELKTTRPNPLNFFRQAIYGFKSPNLRAFYSEEGLIPEIRHVIHLVIFYNLGSATVLASVFVRVAERLKGNTWYILAAGALVFLRVPAEIVNMRRSLRMTKNLPGSRLQRLSDSEEFRAVYETKAVRGWRNFERAYTNLFRSTEYLPEKMERYRLVKPKVYQMVKEGKQAEILNLLNQDLGLDEPAIQSLAPLVKNLQPLDREEIVRVFTAQAERLKEAGLLRESERQHLMDFIKNTFPGLLEWNTMAGAYKVLSDVLKRAERAPQRTELHTLLNVCQRALLPFRRTELLLLISLYAIGYSATYSPDMPTFAFPLFYLFYGIMSQLILSGLERFSNPVWMQYIFRELENDPAIPSASDVWNEYNSQIMRLLTLFSSAGLVLGLSGRLLAKATHNVSWFGVEALALCFYLFGFREWNRFYRGLVRRCRL